MENAEKSFRYNTSASVYHGGRIQIVRMYIIKYDEIPNRYLIQDRIDCNGLYKAIKIKFRIKEDSNKVIRFSSNIISDENDAIIIHAGHKLMIYICNNAFVLVYGRNHPKTKIDELITLTKRYINKKKATGLYLFSGSKPDEIYPVIEVPDLKKINVKAHSIDYNTYYNDDIDEARSMVSKFLASKQKGGLLILYGKPGTGKTYFIRNIVSKYKKQFIYIPPNMMENITNPENINNLHFARNSVFIIEDCEKLLLSRNQGNYSSGIINLLNLSDGLLEDAFNIKIICTFNCSVNQIDEALLRHGRLFYKYEFKELDTIKIKKWKEKYGHQDTDLKPAVLSDLFSKIQQ